MNHSLINPNQLRHFGTIVQDNPYCKDNITYIEANIPDNDKRLHIPLKSKGINILFETRVPTQQELDDCPHVILTSDSEWNPTEINLPNPSYNTQHIQLQCSVLHTSCYHTNTFIQKISSLAGDHTEFASNQNMSDIPIPQTFMSQDRKSFVNPDSLSDKWLIGRQQAQQTIHVTTQRGIHSAILPLSRRYRADRFYQRKRLDGHFYTDTYYARSKSLHGNTCAQIFANKEQFVKAYPMTTKRDAGKALRTFIHEYGVPTYLTFDGAPEQVGENTLFMDQVRKNGIDYHISAPGCPNQNSAEGVIRELRKKWFRLLARKKVPKRVWDYGLEWIADIHVRSSHSTFTLQGRTPFEYLTGETPDISEYVDFGFWDRVWYKDDGGLSERKIGRWLGVSHKIGNAMSYFILSQTGKVVSRTTVQCITTLELQTSEVQQFVKEYDEKVSTVMKDDQNVLAIDNIEQNHLLEDPDLWEEFHKSLSNEDIPEADEANGLKGTDDVPYDQEPTPDTVGDTYLSAELAIPRHGYEYPQYAKVIKRRKDQEGNPVGIANNNPILDTREYVVEFMDGHEETMAANLIAEHLFSQVDDDGNRQVLLDEIIDHRVDTKTAVQEKDAYIRIKSGQKKRKKTTKGWELLVKWRDGSTNWISLKDMKESYTPQVAEYAVASHIDQEPAFAWWVPHTMRKKEAIISKVKSAYWLTTHKYGIKMPKTVEEALKLDKENGNTLWYDAITKEMKNVRIAFEEWKGKENEIPPGYQKNVISYSRLSSVRIFEEKQGL